MAILLSAVGQWAAIFADKPSIQLRRFFRLAPPVPFDGNFTHQGPPGARVAVGLFIAPPDDGLRREIRPVADKSVEDLGPLAIINRLHPRKCGTRS